MSMAIQIEVTVHIYGQASHLGSKATNQSQFLPTCVSDFVLFCFFPIYIYFLLNSILFLIFSFRHSGTAYLQNGVIVSSLSGGSHRAVGSV